MISLLDFDRSDFRQLFGWNGLRSDKSVPQRVVLTSSELDVMILAQELSTKDIGIPLAIGEGTTELSVYVGLLCFTLLCLWNGIWSHLVLACLSVTLSLCVKTTLTLAIIF